jgi:TolB protein
MKKILIFFIVFMSLLCAGMTLAQTGFNIRDVHGRLTEKSTFEPTRISVEDVRHVSADFISYADTVVLRNSAIILRKDLDFSPYFELVPLDSFFMKHMELKEMSLLAWQRLGSQYLVKLEAEFPREDIRLKYRLYNIETGREIRSKGFKTKIADYRALVHTIANDIVKTLTGDDGIYLSKIVYVKQTDSIKELYKADYDGYNEHQLTNNNSINISPAAGPDGKHIFFTSYMDSEPKLYRLTLEDNSVKLISGQPGINAAPAISPDGKKLACVLSKDGNSEIYLMDTDGNIKKRLTNSWAIESTPTFSPDGNEMAFTSDRTGAPQIYIMDTDGGNMRRLTYQGGYNGSPCWSPNGDRIVFVSRYGSFKICSIDLNGRNFQVLADLGNNENPHFSPDGNHIIFSSNRLGPTDIYTMDLFGSGQRRITRRSGFSNPIWLPERK